MSGLRIGLVCPYSFDRPGGVQNHVLGLARALRALGHRPAVLGPGERPPGEPDLAFTSVGPTVPVPYNGSVARVSFGPVTAGRVRRWLRCGDFDLVHLHEPITPSIALLALGYAETPVVATFHTATPRSRTMQVAGDALRPLVEKIAAGVAVSEPARDVVVRHLGRDAVVIPNGFDHDAYADVPASPPSGGPWRGGDRPRLTFLGRLDEPRKGLAVLVAALPRIRAAFGPVEVCLAGHGTPPLRSTALRGCRVLGGVSEAEKRALLATTDVFVAPQVARESFGIVLLEALAAGAEVVASDLPAFVDLLASPDGPIGTVFGRGDPAALAEATIAVLGGAGRSQPAAGERARSYDWSAVAPSIADVYRTVLASTARTGGLDSVGRTWRVLDEALVQRARWALGLTDPRHGDQPDASRLRVHAAALAALAAAAEQAPQPHRERVESDLSRSLSRAGLTTLPPAPDRSEHDRAGLARRLHNDAVARAVRTRRAGSAGPRAFEMAES